ncbi:hypothetical protein ZIOFF_045309 [Zingiber officinale]|uniref:NAC domain-containing protein n=1 Tax=Zingiber officinale TaxID=94328 RepID=A0A8J5L0X8_ZINOF|nr:hypothetical protein ZIOFF_045309 [Zingiber officinale]
MELVNLFLKSCVCACKFSEVQGLAGELVAMEVESCVPPGFRFHPTEEELVGYYLARKVACQSIDLDVIRDVDLYRIEPWDLQDRCKYGDDEQSEWYFFSFKDRKYPSGTRTNRATAAGFWKATGRDKPVLSNSKIIGMRKTLVFYKGRAPNGRKSDWIMHEYRLQTSEHGPPQAKGWVVCRAFQKPNPSTQRPICFSPSYTTNLDTFYSQYDPEILPVNTHISSDQTPNGYCGINNYIPHLESPTNLSTKQCLNQASNVEGNTVVNGSKQLIDWKILDKLLLASSSASPKFIDNNDNSNIININESGSCSAMVDEFGEGAHEQGQSQVEHFLSIFEG